GARGASASSEAADAVLLVDRLDRLAEGIFIAQRSRRIALQSVFAGMGLSLVAMGFAASGFIAPMFGALLQEVIDVAVILNALRAATPPRASTRRHMIPQSAVEQLRTEHDHLMPFLDRLDAAARAVSDPEPEHVRPELEAVGEMLRTQLLPHERADEESLYPRLAGVLHGSDPLAAMSRTHREIFHLARLYSRLLEDLPPGPLPDFELGQLRRLLYSLSAILRLHFVQEEEIFQIVALE
ncbi:MAG: heavy metal translocating P-type ATPase, partial [Gammaproteobacteria bacterium]